MRLQTALVCALSFALVGCGGGKSESRTSASLVPALASAHARAARGAASGSSYVSLVLADAPIAYYRLNDAGTILADSASHHLDGIYGAAVGHTGEALDAAAGAQSATFDGAPAGSNVAANAATVTANPLFAQASKAVTVEAWIAPAVLNTTGQYMPLVSYGREAQGQAWVLQLSPQSGLNFWGKIRNGSMPFFSLNGPAVLPGHIYHVVATYNGTQAQLYVDGTLAASTAVTGSLDYSGLLPPWGLAIGGALGSTEPIACAAMSEVAIYPTALSAADISAHYAAGQLDAAPAPSNHPTPAADPHAYARAVAASHPVAYYHLSDPGAVLVDSGGLGLDGVYGPNVRHGAAAITSTGNAASDFPGAPAGSNVAANTATLPSNAAFGTTSGVTVEAWIRPADFNRTGTFVPIVAYGRQAVGNVWALQYSPQSTLTFYFKVVGGAGSYSVRSAPLNPAGVYAIAATYDGSIARVFVNGAQATSMPATGALNFANFPPQYGLTIGGAAGGNAPTFAGEISDVAVYPVALAPATIASHYLLGHATASVSETPSDSDVFVDSIGVVTHLRSTGPYTASFPTFAAQLQASGIRHVGDSLTTSPGFYFQEIQQLAQAGIRFSLITDFRQDAEAITSSIAAFGSAIEAVEGPNEPDVSGDPNWVADTRAFQRMLYTTVKGNAATARLPVIGPSLTSLRSDQSLGDVSAFMDDGSMHDYFDGYNPGTPGWGSLSQYGIYGSLAYNSALCGIVAGSKPLISTENGYGDAPTDRGGVDDRTLARYIPRLFLEHFLHGVLRTTVYEFYDEPGNGNFDDFGLVSMSGVPKSSYYAIKSLIGALADPGPSFATTPLTYVLSGNVANIDHLLLQKRNGTYELLLWAETPSYDPVAKVDIGVPAQTVTLQPATQPVAGNIATINDDGSLHSAGLAFVNGSATFTVDDRVTIVSFK